jgi:hypothetical protein
MLAAELALYLSGIAGPWCWATHHCGTFTAGWVRRSTGRDPLALLQYGSAEEWVRAARDAGGLDRLVSRALHCEPVPAAMAQAGDIVMLPGRITGGALGICNGRTAAVLVEDGAVAFEPMTEALCAWRLREVA